MSQKPEDDFSKPELVFGLIGPLGVDLKIVERELSSSLKRFGYAREIVKVSSVFKDRWPLQEPPVEFPEADRITQLMDAGDKLRTITGRKDSAVLNALRLIPALRSQHSGNHLVPASGLAFVINSLKTPEEVETLRSIYGGRFIAISCYAPALSRLQAKAKQIAKDSHEHQSKKHLATAQNLLYRDDLGVEEVRFGQNIAETFPKGDFFLDVSDRQVARQTLRRLLDLLFGNTFITPTKEEYAMFHAYGSALRSASLGRQVGAAIATKDGDVVALGTNEVPKAFGGMYWPGPNDYRDFQVSEEDPNEQRSQNVLADTLTRLLQAGWRPSDASLHGPGLGQPGQAPQDDLDIEVVVGAWLKKLQTGDEKELINLRNGILTKSLIEFHRTLHAEMAALMDAARRGVSVQGCTLFCTAFPCHLCAPHIVASGIERVVFIEPYPKSLVEEQFGDSIEVNPVRSYDTEVANRIKDKASFESFVGLAPRRYAAIFEMAKRKSKSGSIIQWDESAAVPRSNLLHVSAEDAIFRSVGRRAELRDSILLESLGIKEFENLFRKIMAGQGTKGVK